jgi:phosphoribosyl 1,2-cyclic phosphate phosphodiesterase
VLLHLDAGTRVLIDTTTDLRAQALAFGVDRVDAILYTHSHADHILGLDEVRRFNVLAGGPLPLYADARTLEDLRRVFSYAFDAPVERGGGVPQLQPFVVEGPFALGSETIVPVPIKHGSRTILGYRVGRFAYLTDCNGIPATSRPLLDGLDVAVIGALRDRPHPTHFTIEEALAVARDIGARRTFFTHMCHEVPHAATCARLPDGVSLAYDGLMVNVESDPGC